MYLNNNPGSSLFHRKRGVANIVLMIGVVLSMAVLLIGGSAIVIKLVEGQARASPEFTATDLISIINIVQAAPESATFNYYTETDAAGYPIIGSLEIDDSTKTLCTAKKTESEMWNTIADKTAIAAEFGGVGYAYDKYRSVVAKRATQNALREQQMAKMFPMLSKNPKVFAKAMETTEEGALTRKIMLFRDKGRFVSMKNIKAQLSKTENKLLAKMEKRNPALIASINGARNRLSSEERTVLKSFNPKQASFLKKVGDKMSYAWERRIGKYTARISSWVDRNSERKVVKFLSGSFKVVKKVPGAGVTTAFVGGMVIAQYFLSGGDWSQTVTLSLQLTAFAVAPKILSYLLVKKFPDFAEKLGGKVAANIGMEKIKARFASAPGVGQVACFTLHLVQVGVNVIWSVWDMYILDVWLAKIVGGANSAVNSEKQGIFCKDFNAQSVLLTPPNCKPKITFGPLLNDFKGAAYAATYTASAVAFSAATSEALATAAFTCTNLGVIEEKRSATLTYLIAAGTIPAVTATSVLAWQFTQHPNDLIPGSTCEAAPETDSCDTTYLRQDCPNWYISTALNAPAAYQSEAAIGLLQGGPVCIYYSILSGYGGMTCNAARVMWAAAVFFAAPENIFHTLLQGWNIGLTKEVKAPQSALGLDKEFANNDGYWYAELPYVIEMTKIYTNDSTLDARRSNFVIRKQ